MHLKDFKLWTKWKIIETLLKDFFNSKCGVVFGEIVVSAEFNPVNNWWCFISVEGFYGFFQVTGFSVLEHRLVALFTDIRRPTSLGPGSQDSIAIPTTAFPVHGPFHLDLTAMHYNPLVQQVVKLI